MVAVPRFYNRLLTCSKRNAHRKAKSYALTDLAQLQKDLKAQVKARDQAEKGRKPNKAHEQRMNSEFLNEVRGATRSSQSRYITDTRPARTHCARPQARTENNKRNNANGTIPTNQTNLTHATYVMTKMEPIYARHSRRAAEKTAKGAWPINARIDLHGKTVEETAASLP